MHEAGSLLPVYWGEIFAIDVPVVETVVRVTVVYLFLVVLMRVVLKREAAGLGLRDVLVVVLVADAVQNGMSGRYTSLTNALVAGATLIFWDYALSWASYQWPTLERLFEPRPLDLIREGRVIDENLRKELLTRDDLLEQLREQGIERLEDVRRAIMEADGRISVLPSKTPRTPGRRRGEE